jgi:hypothetical protein
MRYGLNSRIGRGVRAGVDERSNYAPSDEGSLVLDFDLTVASSYTVISGAVSQITNIASGVSWAQATSGKRPAYDATGWNGGPCLVPDGVDDLFLSTESAIVAALQASTSALPYTIFIVCSPAAALTSYTLLGAGNTGFSNTRVRRWGTAAVGYWAYAHIRDDVTQLTVQTNQTGDTAANVKRLISYWGQVSHFVQRDRAPVVSGSGTPVATTIDQAALFARPDSAPDNFFSGKFVRALLFAAQLNTDAIARVQDHLQSKHL